ncbi:MAG: ubiquitin-like small modifier protein 1 [Haloarculaceae archaeon]
MDVTFVCYATIRDAAGRKEAGLSLPEEATVGEALRRFTAEYDGVAPLVFDGDGDVRPNVNVLVDDVNVRELAGAETSLVDGATVALAPGVAGGRAATPAPADRTGGQA